MRRTASAPWRHITEMFQFRECVWKAQSHKKKKGQINLFSSVYKTLKNIHLVFSHVMCVRPLLRYDFASLTGRKLDTTMGQK